MNRIATSVLGSVTYLALDYVWLAVMMPMYKENFRKFTCRPFPTFDSKRKLAVVFAYIVICVSMSFFVWSKIPEKNHSELLIHSSVLGFFVYSVYNLTNYVTISDYSISIMVYDTLWGIFAFTMSTLVAIFLFSTYRAAVTSNTNNL